jgi:hypothetical protein
LAIGKFNFSFRDLENEITYPVKKKSLSAPLYKSGKLLPLKKGR